MGTFIKYFFLVGLCLFLTSYSFNKKKSCEYKFSTKIDSLDLSHKNLDSIPDLSCAKIDYLNLSNNNITYYDESKLPKDLRELDLSKNKIKGTIRVKTKLEKINLSFNQIKDLNFKYCIKNINVSHNDLSFLHTSGFRKRIDTLNISHNKNLSSILHINPDFVNFIIRDSIKDERELIWDLYTPRH